MTESVLASLHIVAILGLVVFASSQAALCRVEWLNAAVVHRLRRLDGIFWGAWLLLLLTGAARVLWGIKGWQWYVGQPLFHVKMMLIVVAMALALRPSVTMRRWAHTLAANGTLPTAQAIHSVRRTIMLHTHVLPVAAVVAVFWARGW